MQFDLPAIRKRAMTTQDNLSLSCHESLSHPEPNLYWFWFSNEQPTEITHDQACTLAELMKEVYDLQHPWPEPEYKISPFFTRAETK